jgi:hypothetical protein
MGGGTLLSFHIFEFAFIVSSGQVFVVIHKPFLCAAYLYMRDRAKIAGSAKV